MSLFELEKGKDVVQTPLIASLNEETKNETTEETKLDEASLKPKIKLKRREKQEIKTTLPAKPAVQTPIDEVSKRFFESQRVNTVE